MRIYTDVNGLAVNAISTLADGTSVEGNLYNVLTGSSLAGHIINFQRGGVAENGVNGLTNEALLSVLIHRTEILDRKFPCQENTNAIAFMQNALDEFNSRTDKRIARGVEGKEVA